MDVEERIRDLKRLKKQAMRDYYKGIVGTKEMVNRISFEIACLQRKLKGGKKYV